eukprot:COSAG06_NODE_669_length_13222_cov_8.235922_8_plen_152_part_00
MIIVFQDINDISKKKAFFAPVEEPLVGHLRENGTFFEFSLCLSRVCLGKIMHFIYKWLKKSRWSVTATPDAMKILFLSSGTVSTCTQRTECNSRQFKTRQGKARQGKARQGKARQGKARQDRTGQDRTGQDNPRQDRCPSLGNFGLLRTRL